MAPLGQPVDFTALAQPTLEEDFEKEGMTTLEQSKATKRAFCIEAARHRYIHVATHGFFAFESQRTALGEPVSRHP